MIVPARVDLRVGRNNDFVTSIALVDGGDPVDLSSMTLQMQVRLWAEAPGAPLINLTEVVSATAEGLYVQDAAAGQFQILIAEDTISALPAEGDPTATKSLAYDIRLTDAAGLKQTYLYGAFAVVPGVTRDA